MSGREYEQLRKIAYGGQTVRKDVVQASDFSATFDPWGNEGEIPMLKEKPADKEVHEQLGEGSFLEKKNPVQEPATLKAAPISLASDGRPVKAVRKPAAEKSYNPTFEDWSNRLDRLGTKEVEERPSAWNCRLEKRTAAQIGGDETEEEEGSGSRVKQ